MKSQATRIRANHKKQYLVGLVRLAKQLVEQLRHRLTPHKARVAAGFGGVLAIALTAALVEGVTTDNLHSEVQTTNLQSKTLTLVPLELELETEPVETDPYEGLIRQVATVQSGDSLSLIFDRMGFSPRQLYEVVSQSEHGDDIGRLFPDKELTFYSNEAGELLHLEYRLNPLQAYLVDKTEEGYQSTFEVREPESYPVVKGGGIQSSFYMAGLDAGLSDNLIMQLAGIFGWDIDFALEIRKGDTFNVVYEDQYLDGIAIGQGNILAAEFVNQGRTYRAIRHTDSEGRSAYYTPEGESMRKAFLRTPLDVFWISSHFDLNRKHPVLNTIRAHKGTDYAANSGTPIRAAGDGRVTSARYSSSYGNVVEIQHGQNYKTLYAHMKGFANGIRTGTHVQQGQIIGYVGSTGLATGPHLHYEFYVNGSVRNPVTVDLPNGDPLSAEELGQFKSATANLIKLLDNPAVQYANDSVSADNPS